MCVPSFHKVGFDYSKPSWKKVAETLEDKIAAIMQASEGFRVNDHEKAKAAIKKIQKHRKGVKSTLSNYKKGKNTPEDAPDNAIILASGEWIVIVDPIFNKLGNSEKHKPWIYHYRKESRELAIIINEESPLYRNLISVDSDDKIFSILVSWAISDCLLMVLSEEFDYSLKDAYSFRDEQLAWLTSDRGGQDNE